MHILILYSSRFGQTLKISQALKHQWQDAGAQVTLANLEQTAGTDLAQFDKIVIGASIRYGHFAKCLDAFTAAQTQQLNHIPSAFFSVSILANKAHKSTPETHTYTRKFFEQSAWQPKLVGIFAGELAYHKYHLVDRYLMKLVMKINKGETNTQAHIEFTDWHKVQQFGTQVMTM
ncbi:MAG: menaquinone-dependent protoporphyrinogen IX dehydrogenase [Vitreoscilla sp.]|jgi:menaquinone-dependent protoporphyrinogen oxidase|nr:menaquinone-dependent protoporphyrinogen IX dehydrogenase [Vitreoscilla sp.]MBP9540275.1 menaquinone-dependent protoporphyrinogen IX dehydrogenase [Vitreoscilla sp.]